MVFQHEWYFLRASEGQSLWRPSLTNQEIPAPLVFLDFNAHGHKHRHRSFSMHRLMHHFLTAPGLDHLPGPWDWPYQTIQENMLPESLAPVPFTWRQPAFELPTLAYSRGFTL